MTKPGDIVIWDKIAIQVVLCRTSRSFKEKDSVISYLFRDCIRDWSVEETVVPEYYQEGLYPTTTL